MWLTELVFCKFVSAAFSKILVVELLLTLKDAGGSKREVTPQRKGLEQCRIYVTKILILNRVTLQKHRVGAAVKAINRNFWSQNFQYIRQHHQRELYQQMYKFLCSILAVYDSSNASQISGECSNKHTIRFYVSHDFHLELVFALCSLH